MGKKNILIDLFCNAGGVATGFHQAGFEVIGVDINPQPNYPFEFIQSDVFTLPRSLFKNATYVHASPPCQYDAAITRGTNWELRDTYPNLYAPTMDLLDEIELPSSTENTGAIPDIVLCGEMFGLGVLRHRNIQLELWNTDKPKHIKHRGYVRGYRHGVWRDGPYVAAYGNGGGKATVEEMKQAMGIDWTDTREELVEMLPPAYGEWIGKKFLEWKTKNRY